MSSYLSPSAPPIIREDVTLSRAPPRAGLPLSYSFVGPQALFQGQIWDWIRGGRWLFWVSEGIPIRCRGRVTGPSGGGRRVPVPRGLAWKVRWCPSFCVCVFVCVIAHTARLHINLHLHFPFFFEAYFCLSGHLHLHGSVKPSCRCLIWRCAHSSPSSLHVLESDAPSHSAETPGRTCASRA